MPKSSTGKATSTYHCQRTYILSPTSKSGTVDGSFLTCSCTLTNYTSVAKSWMGTNRSSGRGKTCMESWHRSADRCVSNRTSGLHACSPLDSPLAVGTDQHLSVAERSLRHTVGCFPTIAPRASFQGPIDSTTFRFKAGSLSEHQLKCCGFVQCQTYLVPPRDNEAPFKGAQAFHILAYMPYDQQPWKSRIGWMKNSAEGGFVQKVGVWKGKHHRCAECRAAREGARTRTGHLGRAR